MQGGPGAVGNIYRRVTGPHTGRPRDPYSGLGGRAAALGDRCCPGRRYTDGRPPGPFHDDEVVRAGPSWQGATRSLRAGTGRVRPWTGREGPPRRSAISCGAVARPSSATPRTVCRRQRPGRVATARGARSTMRRQHSESFGSTDRRSPRREYMCGATPNSAARCCCGCHERPGRHACLLLRHGPGGRGRMRTACACLSNPSTRTHDRQVAWQCSARSRGIGRGCVHAAAVCADPGHFTTRGIDRWGRIVGCGP